MSELPYLTEDEAPGCRTPHARKSWPEELMPFARRNFTSRLSYSALVSSPWSLQKSRYSYHNKVVHTAEN